ncbi:MAG: response regulator [Candidatus Omnitrophica bacterium]|nr:response regulator [Candidatus Omnitrophota bacterium]
MGIDLQKDEQRPLTTGQIAQYCHVSHRAVLKWVASGKLKAYRTPGKHSRVSVHDFLSFLRQYEMPIPHELQATVIPKKILIVDDDRGIVSSLQRALTLENKYHIATAYDGFEAGKKFVAFRPQLIILDIHMPGLDGYQVCANIRSDPNNKAVRILAISGVSELAEIQKIIDLGADDYLGKPFSNKILNEKVSRMLGESV